MSKPAEIEARVQQAASELGSVGILVNNAGIQDTAAVKDFPQDRWDAIIAINLTAAFVAQQSGAAGQEWLFYRAFPLNVAFLRGTTADPNGNVTAEREALDLDNLATAMAVRNSGGIVIVQAERIARAGSLHPRQVLISGALVDCVVVAEPDNHWQTADAAERQSVARCGPPNPSIRDTSGRSK